MTGIGAGLGLSDSQHTNARGIIAAVRARGWPIKAAYIAVACALTESGMRVLANRNVPDSLNHPHDLLSWSPDGLGGDHASVGMFQQQTGTAYANPGTTTMGSALGWGIPADLMDPEKSTELFLDALAGHDWAGMTNWDAAQAVQHSAFADGSNYRAEDARARAIVDALWPAPTSTEDDMFSDSDRKMLDDLHDRLTKIDVMAYNVDGGAGVESLRTVVGKMRQDIQALNKKLDAVAASIH